MVRGRPAAHPYRDLGAGTERWIDLTDPDVAAIDELEDNVGGWAPQTVREVANDQNEVMKRLTVVASVLLLPTFIVGRYGQNLRGAPELHWSYGYWFSWGLIVVTTLAQLLYFRRKRWI